MKSAISRKRQRNHKRKKKDEEDDIEVEQKKKSTKTSNFDAKKKKSKKSKRSREKEEQEDIVDWPPYVRLKEGRSRKRLVRDIKVEDFSLSVPGQVLIEKASLTLVEGQTYGIIGRNGIGKSVLLKELAHREVPFDKIPDYIRILYVEQEIVGNDQTPLESVLKADDEREWLLDQEKILLKEERDEELLQEKKAKEREARAKQRKKNKKTS